MPCRAAASKVQRARVLLAVDSGVGGPAATDREAAAGGGLTVSSIQRLRSGLRGRAAWRARTQGARNSAVAAKVTGVVEASIVKIASSEAPEGRSRWILRIYPTGMALT